jgi:hypothetical protein
MSHPENTFKEIIEKQNKKIEGLIDILMTITMTFEPKSSVGENYIKSILDDLENLRNES